MEHIIGALEADALRSLLRFAAGCMSIETKADLYWYVARDVVGGLGFEDCVIYEVDADHDSLVQVAAHGAKNPSQREIVSPLVIEVGRGVTGTVAKSGTTLLVRSVNEFDDHIVDVGSGRSELCVPIRVGDRIVGVIDSEHPALDWFTDTHVALLEVVAALTGDKLLTVEALAENRRQFDELKKEHELRLELERRLRHGERIEALGRLTAGIAHDFNNLLAVIVANAELLATSESAAERQRLCTSILNTAHTSAELIHRIQEFSAIATSDPQPFEVDRELQSLRDVLERSASKSVRIEWEFAAPDAYVRADRVSFRTAMVNLVMNASDAMPTGGLIEVHTHIEPDGDGGDTEYVHLRVSDSGEGIDKRHVHRVFDPYFSTKPSQPDHLGGVGLGLSMVYGFVQKADGTVWVESARDVGTTVHVRLPLSADRIDQPTPDDRSAPIAEPEEPLNVLLVDDEADLTDALREALTRHGHAVTPCRNGIDALEMWETSTAFDVVVTDEMMPGVSGMELAERIWADRPATPVVFISGRSRVDSLDFGAEHRFRRLGKPFETASLLEVIDDLTQSPT